MGLIDLMTVEQGTGAIARARAELNAEGFGDGDRRRRVRTRPRSDRRRGGESAFSVGASGLGLGLARALSRGRADGRMPRRSMPWAEGPRSPRAVVQATLEQIAAAETEIPVLRLASGTLLDGDAETARALELGQGPHRVRPGVDRLERRRNRSRVPAALRPRKAGQSIEHALAEIAAGFVAFGVRRLVVAGGETSGAVSIGSASPHSGSARKSPQACR